MKWVTVMCRTLVKLRCCSAVQVTQLRRDTIRWI